jgi:hypothetical protein
MMSTSWLASTDQTNQIHVHCTARIYRCMWTQLPSFFLVIRSLNLNMKLPNLYSFINWGDFIWFSAYTQIERERDGERERALLIHFLLVTPCFHIYFDYLNELFTMIHFSLAYETTVNIWITSLVIFAQIFKCSRYYVFTHVLHVW